MKRIGINAHLLTSQTGYRRAGIHHYIAQILRHLPPDEALRYTIFTDDAPDFVAALPAALPMQLVRSPWPTSRPQARILWEQLVWPLSAGWHRVDLLHSMAFVTPWLAVQPAVVTVYDLSFLRYPELFPGAQRLYLTTQTRRSCRRARHVITISESGRRDIHCQYGVPLERITVVYPGVDERFRPAPAEEIEAFRARERLPERFLLHVGTLQPRKNIPLLIEAMSLLKQPDLHLVLVGGRGWLYDDIFARMEALGLNERVHFIGYVTDEELPLWYSAADLLVFPSVYEGFGMPIVQAMACGTPVVASNASAMPEAVGAAGLTFDPADPHAAAALAERIASVLENPAQLDTMRTRGFEQVRKFSWSQAGRATAVCYHRAIR